MQNKGNEQNTVKEVKEIKAPENAVASVPYIVYESEQARSERHIKRLAIITIIAIAMLFASNLIWLMWTHSAYYKKSRNEKGSSREFERRFFLKFIFAMPKSL